MTKYIFKPGERCYLGYSASYRAPEATSVFRTYKTKEGKRRLSVESAKQVKHIFEYDPDHGWFSLEHSGRTILTEQKGKLLLQQRQNKAVLERIRERCQLLLAANDADGIQQLNARLKLLLELPRIMPGVMKPALCERCARQCTTQGTRRTTKTSTSSCTFLNGFVHVTRNGSLPRTCWRISRL